MIALARFDELKRPEASIDVAPPRVIHLAAGDGLAAALLSARMR